MARNKKGVLETLADLGEETWDKQQEGAKKVGGFLKDNSQDAYNWAAEGLSSKWEDFKEGAGMKARDSSEFRDKAEEIEGLALSDADKRAAFYGYQQFLKDGPQEEAFDLAGALHDPEKLAAWGKNVKEEQYEDWKKDTAFGDLVSAYDEGTLEKMSDRLAKEDQQATADKWSGMLADATRAMSKKKEYIPPRANFAGSVKADLGGMQGILSARGNPLAMQNLKLTA